MKQEISFLTIEQKNYLRIIDSQLQIEKETLGVNEYVW